METDAGGESILVVDDDLKYLKLIRALLQSEGYDVRTAANAASDRHCSYHLSSIQSRTEPKAFGVRCKAIFMNLLTRRARRHPGATKGQMKILVVDDSQMNRKLLKAWLESEKFAMVDAADGREALEVLNHTPVTAIISEILMPRMDGYRLCYEVRKNPKLRALPFIVYTATYTSPSDEKVALNFGADKFLRKPASPVEMIGALHEVIKEAVSWHRKELLEPQELLAMREYSEALARKLEENNAQLVEANKILQERMALAEFNAEIARALTDKGILREILQLCTEAMVRHLDAAFARVWTHNKKDHVLELQASAGMYTHINGGHARVPVGKFEIGLIASEQKPHLTNSVIGDNRMGDQEWAKREGMVAFAGYPLIVEEQLFGVMAMFARKPLSTNTLTAMESVAKGIASGIERKWADEERQKNLDRLRALHEIDKATHSTFTLTEVLDILLESVERSCPFAAATGVRLLEKETQRMIPLATRNISVEEWKGDLAQTGGPLIKTLLETKSPVAIANLARDARTNPHIFARKHGLVSYLGIPLVVKDAVIGTLVIYTKEEHAFSIEEIEFCVTLAGQAALAIHNATLYLQTERHLKRIEALREIDKAITSTLDLRAVLDLLLEKIEVFLPFPAATTIRLFNLVTRKFENTACRGIDESKWQTESRNTGQLAMGMRETKSPVIIDNIQTDNQRRVPSFIRQQGFVSYLGVPLIAKHEVVGILGFYSRKLHEFTQQEIDFLLTLAGQAAIAIHNAQLFQEVDQSKTELETTNRFLGRSLKQLGGLYTALAPITVAASDQEMIGGIIDKLLDATGADAGLVRIWDRKANYYPIVSHRYFPDDYLQRVAAAPPGGAVDWVLHHGEPIIAADIALEARLKGKIQLLLGLRSCAMLPLKVHGEVRGVMHIASRTLGYFNEQQKDHLLAIARLMGIALENRELFYDLKASRDELAQANKVKDEFLGVISHELRTPLNVLMGYVGLLKDGSMGILNEEQQRTLEKVLGCAGEQLDMINTVLQTILLDAVAIVPQRQFFDVGEFLRDLRSEYDRRIYKKNLSLTWNYPAEAVQLSTDSAKLKQILQNLVNNAIKFTDQGNVTVSAAKKEGGKKVEFKVADTGIGISKELQTTIFEKLYQVDSSTARSYGGLGLGLYIVKKLIELLEGTVELESEPGKGSTFTVMIPSQT